MNTKTKIFVIIAILVFSGAPIALAHEGNKIKSSDNSKVNVKIESKTEDEDDDKNEVKTEIKVRANSNSFKFETEGDKFEARGEITSVTGNAFVILEQTITIDPSKVNEFKQKGIIEKGKIVKVEGEVKDGKKFAREIMILGTGQGRFKIKINGQEVSLTPTATPSTTITPSVTITPSSNVQVKIKAKGPVDEVTKFLEQILSLLKNLI